MKARGLPDEDSSVLNVLCPSVISRGVPREGMSVHLHVVCSLVALRRVPEEDLSVLHHYVWLLLGP